MVSKKGDDDDDDDVQYAFHEVEQPKEAKKTNKKTPKRPKTHLNFKPAMKLERLSLWSGSTC